MRKRIGVILLLISMILSYFILKSANYPINTAEDKAVVGILGFVLAIIMMFFYGAYYYLNVEKKMEEYEDIIKKGDARLLEQIMAQSPGAIKRKDEKGNTLLHFAAGGNQKEIIKILLRNNADINVKNDDGKTSLDIAQELENNQEIMDVFNQHKTKY